MRTKTIILSAACGLVAAAAANADSVYSVNVVGYVNKTIPAGTWAILANPLANGTGNTLTNLFPSFTLADKGTAIYLWDATGSTYVNYNYVNPTKGWKNADTGEYVNNATLAPGQGFWIFPAEDISVTFVGDVQQGTQSVSLAAGWNLIGSIIPTSDDLPAQGLTGNTDDFIYKFNSDGTWTEWLYKSAKNAWKNADTGAYELPIVTTGEGFWYNAAGSFTWTRTFTVSQ